MQTYKRQTLEGKSLVLEEVAFIECVLRDCDLFYSGGDFEWQNTTFENCRFHWRGPAKNTFSLFQTFGLLREPTPGSSAITKSSQTVH